MIHYKSIKTHNSFISLNPDIEASCISSEDQYIIQKFTKFLDKEYINIDSKKYPSIDDLQLVVQRVLRLVQMTDSFEFKSKKVIAEFILSLELWATNKTREEATLYQELRDFLLIFEKEMGYQDD